MRFAALLGFALACGIAGAAPEKSIVETAEATPELSSLVSALVTADLVDALSGDGPFTVFAPTNDAFDAISSTVAGLSTEQLKEVLEYHVVNAEAKAEDLSDMEVLLPLLRGHSLGVHIHPDGTVRIVGENNAVTVTTANVLCTNGVVHIVDAVIVPNVMPTPPAPSPDPPTDDILEIAMSTPQLSSLVDAIKTAGLVDALSGDGPFTVFAPTNDAFDAISSVVAGLTTDQLAQVLEYHVVNGEAKSSDLTNMQVLSPLLSGHSLGVDLEEQGIRIVGETNAVSVTIADRLCTNGVVHIVDAVLVPKLGSSTVLV
jgi:transforming growth factor-beta-induced protein